MEPASPVDPAMNILTGVAPLTIDRDLSEVISNSQAVDRIQQPVGEVNYPISEVVARFKHEFHSILNQQTNSPMNSSSMVRSISKNDSSTITLSESELQEEYATACKRLGAEAITDLRRIAAEMNSVGHLRDCAEEYKCVRKTFINTHFRRLGIENFTASDRRRIQLDDLKKMVDVWIRAALVCVKILFKKEKEVYEQIFEGIGTTATYEVAFIGTVKDAAVQLFKFADALISSPAHAKKIFKILGFYNALFDLSSDISCLFPLESARSIGIDTPQLLSRTKEVVGKTLSDFENSLVHPVPTKFSESRSTIHEVTTFVMKYVGDILNYKRTLSQLKVSNPPTSFGALEIPDMELVTPREGQTALGLHMILIIVVLRFNLELKLTNYEDPSLVKAPDIHRTESPYIYLFMMNNVHYIVQRIKGCPELKEIVGEEYLGRLSKKVRAEMNVAQKLICQRISHCLRDEGLRGRMLFSKVVSKTVVRERITMFNARLEDVRRCQPTWVIPDVQLRDEIRLSISTELVPAYKSFLDRYGSNIEKRKYPNIVKYSVEELGTFISTYFFS